MNPYLEEARARHAAFQARLREKGIGLAVLTDESSIAYLAGFWGYLGVEFGRPTFLIVRADGPPTGITPLMEAEMVAAMTWVDDVRPWQDAGSDFWTEVLEQALGPQPTAIGVEAHLLPAIVRRYFDERHAGVPLSDIAGVLGAMRVVKSPLEIEIMGQAGRIGRAMMEAASASIGEGVPEYEAALAVLAAGTRAAAGFLSAQGWEAFVSPVIHNLQIMQSGRDTAMVHRRAAVKRMERGDPVYFCFCNLIEFKHYRLGFDRVFFIGAADDEAARVQETAIAAQRAALDAIRPGAVAEEVAAAANEIYRTAGFAAGYRTGRSIGVAYLEAPELKAGDRTSLAPGMTFAVDGGVTIEGRLGGRIGDSIVVTETGYEFLTDYPRSVLVV